MFKLTKKQLQDMNDVDKEDFVLINVLSREDFNEQHIRTSINIPLKKDNFEELVEMVAGSKSRKIVVYCASFECDASPTAAKRLEKDYFTQVYDYEGGTKDWMS